MARVFTRVDRLGTNEVCLDAASAAHYMAMGATPTFLKHVYYQNHGTARLYVVDNSRSTNAPGGTVFTPSNQAREVSVWDEIKQCVTEHARFNAVLGCPAQFALLNPLGLAPVEVLTPADANTVSALMRGDPRGGTPLVSRLKEMEPVVAELLTRAKKVVIVIVTDGVPEEGNESFVEQIKRMTTTLGAVDVVLRICSDDNSVIDW